jgi:hypothetical protein
MTDASGFDYEVTTEDGISIVRQRTPMSVHRITTMYEELAALPIASRRVFVLHPEYRFSGDEMRHLAEAARHAFTEPSWTAMVTTSELQYGLMRMYGSLRDTPDAAVRVFTDETSALAWLAGIDAPEG